MPKNGTALRWLASLALCLPLFSCASLSDYQRLEADFAAYRSSSEERQAKVEGELALLRLGIDPEAREVFAANVSRATAYLAELGGLRAEIVTLRQEVLGMRAESELARDQTLLNAKSSQALNVVNEFARLKTEWASTLADMNRLLMGAQSAVGKAQAAAAESQDRAAKAEASARAASEFGQALLELKSGLASLRLRVAALEEEIAKLRQSGAELPHSGGGFSTRIQGSERGNSLETRLGGAADKVGRSLYVPVYLYLPLPSRLDEALVSRLPGSQAGPFLAYYEKTSSGYRLLRQPPLSERDRLWIGLEDAGYDLDNAEYKRGRRLSPVELEFVVTPAANAAQPRLEALRITGSSGDRAVDEAVQYGFRRATFFNSTGAAVSGSFSYRFD